MGLLLFRPHAATVTPPAATVTRPTIGLEIAFTSQPLDTRALYIDVSAYMRGVSTQRGRNYEYERTETGTEAFTLSNRDSRFNPDNTAGPYYPNLKPTRRTRTRATWDMVYDLFHGFTKGYPQEFPNMGNDAIVQQQARDEFYLLNMTKFQPSSTTLTLWIDTPDVDHSVPVTSETEQQITVASTLLPMPRAVPFTITIDDENMQVIAIESDTVWTVLRAQDGTVGEVHAPGATITTKTVSFGEELSGTRMVNVLTAAGIPAGDWNIDQGIALIAQSDDLAGTNMLEHMQAVAEAENGRLFVSRDGKITFHSRHWSLLNERSDRATFADDGSGIEYALGGPVTHDEARIYNVIRVTPASENVQTAEDATSIADNFERVLEKQWPLASDAEAKAAAEWLLFNLKDATVRIPRLTLFGRVDPTVMWPILLAMDIGQRYGFTYTPKGGGTPIAFSVIVEGIGHDITPENHVVNVDFSPADTTQYWQLGVAGKSELGDTTRITY